MQLTKKKSRQSTTLLIYLKWVNFNLAVADLLFAMFFLASTKMNIIRVPSEILVMIFRHLSLSDLLICSLVCKEWHAMFHSKVLHSETVLRFHDDEQFQKGLLEPSLWKSVFSKLTLNHAYLTNRAFEHNQSFQAFFLCLNKLTLDGCREMRNCDVICVLKQCSNLKSLHFSFMNFDDDMLINENDRKALKMSLANVVELVLSSFYRLSDTVFDRIVECMHNIQYFEIDRHCANLDFQDLRSEPLQFQSQSVTSQCIARFIKKRAHKIKYLKLDYMRDIDFDVAEHEPKLALVELGIGYLICRESTPQLKLVEWEKVKALRLFLYPIPSVSTVCLDNVLEKIRDVKQLSIGAVSNCEIVSENFKQYFAHMNSLVSLKFGALLKNNRILSRNFVNGIKSSKFGETLNHLDLSSNELTSKAFIEIIALVPNLTSLILYSAIREKHVVEMDAICRYLRKLKNLSLKECYLYQPNRHGVESCKFLNRTRLANDWYNGRLDMEEAMQIAQRIESYTCPCVPPKAVASLTHLVKLDVSYTDIDDVTLMMMVGNIMLLRYVNLAKCENLSDRGIVFLAQKNRSLEVIILEDDHKITDNGLIEMLQKTKRLAWLDISGCKNVSAESLKQLPLLCPYLTHLDVTSCPNILAQFFENTPLWNSLKRSEFTRGWNRRRFWDRLSQNAI